LKLENRRVEQVLPGWEGVSTSGSRLGKGHERVNMVQILCSHYVNRKMRLVRTIPGMRGEKDKGEWWRG
jgi:hypothetical protein